MLGKLRESLHRAQQRMVKQANSGRRDVQYAVNDWVYLKLRPYRQSTLGKHTHPKLAPRFVGPFQALAKVGSVAYRLALPPEVGIHPVFHVSMLWKAVGTNFPVLQIPPSLAPNLTIVITLMAVLGLRQSVDGLDIAEVLIQWTNSLSEDATWEQPDSIISQFVLIQEKNA